MCHIAMALALFLLSVCAVQGAEDLLQPATYRSYEAKGGGNLKQRSIIHDLLKRQYYCNPGYGYCSNRGQCCPVGGGCCNDGKCCPSGSFCSMPGYCCYNNQYICENVNCCYNSEQCCSDGGCCKPGYYCVVGTDGKIGCCQNGTTCYGPVGGGGGGGGNTPPPPPPPPPTKSTPTTAPTTSQTSQITSSSSTSTGTPAAIPSPSPGFNNVIINADDPSITWSNGKWTLGKSSCYEAQLSMKTTLTDQWLTYITPANASASIYLDISWTGVTLNILIDGVKFSISLSTLSNCEYNPIPIIPGSSHNITIFVSGQSTPGMQVESSSGSSSFEFNGFVFGEQSPTTTSSASVTTGLGSSQKNSANRMGPGGVIVAAGALLSAMMIFLL